MFSNKLTTLVLIFGAIQVGYAVNYCLSTFSCGGIPNIGCNNTGAFSPSCPADKKLVTITPALKTAILKSHNTKRNLIASGNLTGFQPATRMATMVWDADLAKLAEYNAKKCVYAHDYCHNTAKFKWAGQNIGKAWWQGITYNDSSVILPLIDHWWSEYLSASMSDISSYPQSPNNTIGHFTVMTAEKNTAVGCASIRFKDSGYDSLTLVCNYARTNIIGMPMYTAGTTASQCTKGKNPTYKALCAAAEVYAVNIP